MLDIRLIREQPDFVKSRLATRGGDEDVAKIMGGNLMELMKVSAQLKPVSA